MKRFLLFVLCTFFAADVAAQDKPGFSITPVKDGVYRFTAGHYHSAFLVTDKHIVLTDPLSKDAAIWLKAELKKRFNKPIRYVIYSHSHPDHAYGGEVFADPGVTFIAHRLTKQNFERTRAKTKLPDKVFDTEIRLRVDNHIIVLRHHGPNNGRGSISMYFETADVMYVVDWIVLGRLMYKDLKGYHVDGVIDSTQEILQYDFDRFVGGHANMGTKADVRRYLEYVEALYDAVLTGMLAGKTLDELKQNVRLPTFKDLAMYDEWLPLNVEGMYV